MPIVVSYDEIKPENIRRSPGGPDRPAATNHPFFRATPDTPDAPTAFLAQYDPGDKSCPHFHQVDQFQILVQGKGTLGRHAVEPYSVHFSRAYTPYGPLYSDGSPRNGSGTSAQTYPTPAAPPAAGPTPASPTPAEPPSIIDETAPPSGGEEHSGNGRGGTDNLAWEIWSNTGAGELTSFPGVTAFRASWNNAGGYLGRMGFEWGNNGEPYTAHGTISAQFVAKKTVISGNGGGGYSYIGMYGWTNNPCIEWYVIEDTFKTLPFNPGGTEDKGTIDVDGGTYDVYTRSTPGTGGDRCGGVANWTQYYSIRTSPRDCGVITLSEHFEKWEGLGMSMAGNLLEAKILAEVGGDAGSVDFPIANVTTTQ